MPSLQVLKTAYERGESYAHLLDEADGHTRLEQLQQHENEMIYLKAVGIIEKYLGVEDEEYENLKPANRLPGEAQLAGEGTGQQRFAFGMAQPSGTFAFPR